MKIKALAFLALGSAATYYAANYPVIDMEGLQVKKNYLTSSYTMEVEGITMKFDKRYEAELQPRFDMLAIVAKSAQKNAAENEKETEEIKEQLKTSIKKAFK